MRVTARAENSVGEVLAVGELLAGTLEELRAIARPVALYLLFFLVAALVDETLRRVPVLGGLFALATFACYFVGQYMLYRIALRQAGLLEGDGRMRIFRFAGMAFALAVPIYIGASLFLLPALFFASKWLLSPCYLVATERGTFASIGQSWRATDGNTLRIALALAVLVAVFAAGFVALAGLFDATGLDDVILVPALLAGHVFALLMMGLSLTVFRALHTGHETLGEVFA